jgi:predicted enzyme related to lactoylglutathione lyase
MSERNSRIDYIELPAADAKQLLQAKDFYAVVFNWQYQDWGDVYADTAGSGVSSGINADDHHRPRTPLVVVFADDLETTREGVIAAKGKISREIFSFPGGRRFHFIDPVGNELAVWSDK